MLEAEFSMEFDGFDRNAKIPANVSEMADALVQEYEQYCLRQARNKAAQTNKAPESISD
ncbi:hypothetical protein [Verminephrobacter eiseniae]|uniref:hypothetical protein n=1 Tax=Verminephrobacter eiseniae TaxID=364317 RepID=UPI0022375841|nr:hypothetical protein [Verminephrobacter eiseniae]